VTEVVQPPDAAPEQAPTPQRWSPPSWLLVVIVLVALIWGTLETVVFGARVQSYSFILAVLFGTLGIDGLGKIRGMLR
jgi:hypothetical protein